MLGNASSNGSFAWSVPVSLPLGADYRVGVLNNSCGSLNASTVPMTGWIMGGWFSLLQVLTVTSPSRGSVWVRSHFETVQWASGNIDTTVKMELLLSGAQSTAQTVWMVAHAALNTGSYSVRVPPAAFLPQNSSYQLRLSADVNGKPVSFTTDFFTIQRSPLEFLAPNDNAFVHTDEPAQLQFNSTTSSMGSGVLLTLLYPDSTASLPISTPWNSFLPRGVASYAWNESYRMAQASNYRFRVQSRTDVSVYGDSGGFTAGPSPPPTPLSKWFWVLWVFLMVMPVLIAIYWLYRRYNSLAVAGWELLKRWYPIATLVLFCMSSITQTTEEINLYHTLGDDPVLHSFLHTDRGFLLAITILFLISVGIIALCIGLPMFINALRSVGRQREAQEQQAEAQVWSLINFLKFTTVLGTVWKLAVYGSILNKLRVLGLWDPHGSDFWAYLGYANPIFPQKYSSVGEQVKGLTGKAIYGYTLTLILYFLGLFFDSAKGCTQHVKAFGKAMLIVPIVVGFLLLRVGGSILVFHFAQRHYLLRGVELNDMVNISIAGMVFTISSAMTVFYIPIMLQLALFGVAANFMAHAQAGNVQGAAMQLAELPDKLAGLTRPLAIFSLISTCMTASVCSHTHACDQYQSIIDLVRFF